MTETLDFLMRHGALVLFAIVFIEQVGVPIPAAPFLLAAGALAGEGKLNLAAAIALAGLGSLLADLIWFHLGRVRGNRILSFLCRVSLEPDSCVRRTGDVFTKHGMRGVVFGKFIPGLSTVMPPLAGIFGISMRRFLFYDGFGSLLYAACFTGLGFLFSHQLHYVGQLLGRLGHGALWVVLGLIAAYIGFKYIQRQRVLRRLRVARITVDELRKMQENDEPVWVVDLRSQADVISDPVLICGARHLRVDDLEHKHQEIPRDRDVVLYCSCPDEYTAARMALRLHKRGITRVRPLLGGLDAWRERRFPMDRHPDHPQEKAASG